MLVSSMTPNEIYDEIMADIPNMLSFLQYKQPKFRKVVLRSQLFPVNVYSMVTTSRKNNWLLLFSAKSKKDVSGDIHFYSLCIQETSAGKSAIIRQVTQGEPSLFIYSPHFFHRYAERMKLELSGIPLIRNFFENNNNSYIKKRIINGKEELTATFEEGVGFCVQLENCTHLCFVMKTFINYDMKKTDQEAGFRESELARMIENAIFTENIRKTPSLLLLDSLLE